LASETDRRRFSRHAQVDATASACGAPAPFRAPGGQASRGDGEVSTASSRPSGPSALCLTPPGGCATVALAAAR